MIKSISHKGLKHYWQSNDASGLPAKLLPKIGILMDHLDKASTPQSLNITGFDFHGLKGKRKGTYSVHVNGPWCITFRFEGTDAIDVNFENYH